MQKTITVSALRTRISDCVDEIEKKGCTYVLMRNGKPVAKLMPADTQTELSPAFAELVDSVFTEYQADLKKLAETP